MAEHDLRDTFAPDLLFGEEKPVAQPAKPPSGGATGGEIADAAGLLADEGPVPKRRGPTAEGRSQPRRCPSCGSVVPAGMSLCGRCGLDLDTGRREVMDEILADVPVRRAAAGPPLPIAVLGSLVLLASLTLGCLALVQSVRPGTSQAGFLSLALIGFFGVYASVQFLRLRSAKLLMIALMLGALIDVIGLIALPIYQANNAGPATGTVMPVPLADEELPQFENIATRLDVRRVKWGIAILLLNAGAMIFLTTPLVTKHFERAPKPSVSLVAY
jgi:hypothetical protein